MFWICFPPLLALSLLLVDEYTAFTEQSIIENPFLSLGTKVEHLYTDVRVPLNRLSEEHDPTSKDAETLAR